MATPPIALTPRQFSLLEFLMRRAGEVLSKATILEHVWDFAYEGDPNIVEVYVRQLRQRIDEPVRPAQPADGAAGGLPARPGSRLTCAPCGSRTTALVVAGHRADAGGRRGRRWC